jgi:hypothetical protein
MKKILLIAAVFTWFNSMAQDTQLKSPPLAVPTSPAFIITDITPTLVQSPNTPKAFVLGVAQSYQQSGSSFPDNLCGRVGTLLVAETGPNGCV